MLPTKTAAILAGLILLPGFAGLASAQLDTPTADLIVESIDIGSPRVADLAARLTITIRNQGNANFAGATGWQIFVGFNGNQDTNCIEPGDDNTAAGQTPVSPCYIRMAPGQATAADGSNASSIPAQAKRTYVLMWKADKSQVTTTGRIHIEILPFAGTPGGSVQNCQGPDIDCSNNRFEQAVVVGQLGVRAEPERATPTVGTTLDKNTAWHSSEITDPCPAPDAGNYQRGCTLTAGKTVHALYKVKNVGTVDDAYTPSVRMPESYLRKGWQVSFAPHNFSLPRGGERLITVTVTVPENETALVKLNVNDSNAFVRWSSSRAPQIHTDADDNPGCTDASIGRYCRDPTLPSLIVDYRRGFNITVAQENLTWGQVVPPDAIRFYIHVNNTGNAEDAFNVTIDNTTRMFNDSWAQSIQGPARVARDAVGNYTVQVSPPVNASNGTYHFDVNVKSYGDTDGSALCKALEVTKTASCSVRLTVNLGQVWQISPINDVPKRVVPGEPVQYNLGIYNSGNGYDNVSLELQTTVAGWDVRLSERVLHLTPGNTTPFTLSVTSPPNIAEGTEASFFVNATSSGPEETPFDQRTKVSIPSKMTILRGPNMRLALPVNSSFVDAGSSTTYEVRVTNVGNVADNFTIPTPTRPADWGIEAFPRDLELQPNQEGTITVRFTAPATADVGDRATATVKVVSKVEPSREKEVSLEGRISGPDFYVENVLTDASNPYSGDPLKVSVVLGNNGNKGTEKNVTVTVHFVQNGVERLVGEKTYGPLGIPAQRRLVEIFPWNTEGIEGAGVLIARIDPTTPELPIGNVREIDDSAASNEKTRPVTLRTFDVKLTPAAGLTARPGEQITYGETPNVFLVEYRGNQPSEPVTIRFESEHGWLTSRSELTLALPRNTPIPVITTLDVPTLPGTARDTLSITVIPALRPDQPLRGSTITTILDEERPRITRIVADPPAAKLGDTVSIHVYVEDATGVSSVTAYVATPANETLALTLVPTGDHWSATQTWPVTGTYRISAEAADTADPPNRNRTRETTGTFTITTGTVPTIKLAADQTTTIRTGAPIRLEIRDPLGIGKITYAIKGVSYEITGPRQEIDTSTFQPGPIEINVTAENIYGAAATQKFSFTVDNTPPGITRVTINPERPRANEDVTVTITTDAKVQAVDIVVKRDGQRLETLNATRKGVGSFETQFNPGEGDYSLDVTARDTAGNTKLAEGAVVFSARPGSPFDVPTPGILLSILAIAAIALLTRRRH